MKRCPRLNQGTRQRPGSGQDRVDIIGSLIDAGRFEQVQDDRINERNSQNGQDEHKAPSHLPTINSQS